jgi:hypothetical protein
MPRFIGHVSGAGYPFTQALNDGARGDGAARAPFTPTPSNLPARSISALINRRHHQKYQRKKGEQEIESQFGWPDGWTYCTMILHWSCSTRTPKKSTDSNSNTDDGPVGGPTYQIDSLDQDRKAF